MLRNYPPPTFDEPGTEDRIRKRVISASKGLAEILATEEPTVQFIHESVRDFLLKDGGLEALWREIGDNNVTHYCHDILKDCCDQYLNHPLIIRELPPQSRRAKRQERHDIRQKLLDKYPLLQYACQNVLWHADAAAYSFPQEIFLSGIYLPHLTAMLNLMEEYESRFYRPDHDLLSIIANRGYAQLIRGWTGGFSVYYTYPIIAAISGRQESACSALMEKTFPGFRVTEYGRLVKGSDRSLCREGHTLLTLAAECGCDKIVERLLEDGVRVDDQDGKGQSACDMALSCDRLSILRLLFRYGGEALWNKDLLLQRCMTQFAANSCSAWLVDEGADANLTLDFVSEYGTADQLPALHVAAGKGMLPAIEAILKRGVDVNEISVQRRQTALHVAAIHSEEQAAQVLLQNGADVNAVDSDGQTPLMAAFSSHKTWHMEWVVEELFKHGADESINHLNHLGQTALMLATKDSVEIEFMQLCRDKGGDCRAVDQRGRSLFWYAHTSPRSEKVERFMMLVKWGIKPSIGDGEEVWSKFRSFVPVGDAVGSG
jgi:ankyrin repeat protein